jgi:hypothetical protein
MFPNESRVLLVLPGDALDRARVLAGKATTALKLPVSLQIVLRALIEQGLKRGAADQQLMASIEAQAQAVRRIRSMARKPGATTSHRAARAGGPAKAPARGR